MRLTQRAIKQVLTERYYSWREAEVLAKSDPEIDLTGEGPLYVPRNFDEDFPAEGEEVFEAQDNIQSPGKETDVVPEANLEVKPEVRSESRPNV